MPNAMPMRPMPFARSFGGVTSAMYALAVPRFAVAMPAEHARDEEPRRCSSPHASAIPSASHRHRRRRDRPHEDRASPDAIREPTPHRHEQELHQRVDRREERADERAHVERVARLRRGTAARARSRGGRGTIVRKIAPSDGRRIGPGTLSRARPRADERLEVAASGPRGSSRTRRGFESPRREASPATRSMAARANFGVAHDALRCDAASSRPTSNCGFTSATSSPPFCVQRAIAGSELAEADERRVDDGEIDLAADVLGRERARVGALLHERRADRRGACAASCP